MRRAVIYLRVSTLDQTTANQERDLREIAKRMGCEIVKVYKDHGISGTRGRDKRQAFDKLCRDAELREFDMVMAWWWTGWAAVCRIWSVSYPSCTRSRSTYSCANRASTRRPLPARRCFRFWPYLLNSNGR